MQRDLVDTFGDPVFKQIQQPIPSHGSELNEYGLQVAYSYLGIANRAFVVRADLDVGQLEASATAPLITQQTELIGLTQRTHFGVSRNGTETVLLIAADNFTNKVPNCYYRRNTNKQHRHINDNGYSGYIRQHTVGAVGDYAVIATTTLNRIYYRNTPKETGY